MRRGPLVAEAQIALGEAEHVEVDRGTADRRGGAAGRPRPGPAWPARRRPRSTSSGRAAIRGRARRAPAADGAPAARHPTSRPRRCCRPRSLGRRPAGPSTARGSGRRPACRRRRPYGWRSSGRPRWARRRWSVRSTPGWRRDFVDGRHGRPTLIGRMLGWSGRPRRPCPPMAGPPNGGTVRLTVSYGRPESAQAPAPAAARAFVSFAILCCASRLALATPPATDAAGGFIGPDRVPIAFASPPATGPRPTPSCRRRRRHRAWVMGGRERRGQTAARRRRSRGRLTAGDDAYENGHRPIPDATTPPGVRSRPDASRPAITSSRRPAARISSTRRWAGRLARLVQRRCRRLAVVVLDANCTIVGCGPGSAQYLARGRPRGSPRALHDGDLAPAAVHSGYHHDDRWPHLGRLSGLTPTSSSTAMTRLRAVRAAVPGRPARPGGRIRDRSNHGAASGRSRRRS
jgi:hypothetical protein